MANHIENPLEYLMHGISGAFSFTPRPRNPAARVAPRVRRLTAADIRDALRSGLSDFGAARDDVVFIALIYPLAGLALAALAANMALLPMVFPLLSGFALLGPLAAIGLYEISRRRESGAEVSWMDAAQVFRSPAIGSIMTMGLIVVALFVAWLGASYALSAALFGYQAPTLENFVQQVFATNEGHAMIAIGVGMGFLFALVAFAVSAVSFPLLLDRHVDVDIAIGTSLRVVKENPGAMALWAFIVVAALILGSLPALLGLIVVVPVLGHATWHLYRKAVA